MGAVPEHNPVDRFGNQVTIDASNFNKAMEGLADITGKSMEKVMKYELARILEKTIKGTKPAKTKLIQERYTYKEGEKPSHRLVGRVRLNGRLHNTRKIKPKIWSKGKRIRNPLWQPMQQQLKRGMKYAKDRRGLAKATWYKQAKDMKLLDVKVPKYVEKAYGHLGRAASRSLAKVWKRKPYVILVTNTARVPMVKEVGGYGAFKRAINGRQRFFETNVAKGVFMKAKDTAEKYGVLVTDPSF
jgi:hypothetical protein